MATVVDQALAGAAYPVLGARHDYDALLDRIGDRRFVLIGEASHGTHEFYRERARITRRLIDELGFTAVAVEADWPDAYRVNRYVMGARRTSTPTRRSPTSAASRRGCGATMTCSSSSSGSARATTRTPRRPRRSRFYGLDLYSLQASIEAVIGYLDRVDPAEARRARERYSCFDHVGREGQAYGYALAYRAGDPVRERGRRPADLAARPGGGVPPPRRVGRRGRALLRGAERARRAQRRGVLPADVPGRGVVVEPPRPAHGRHAGRARSTTSITAAGRPRSSCGSTTRTSATHGRPRWARAAS